MKKKINPADFKVPPGEELKLCERATKVKPFFKSKNVVPADNKKNARLIISQIIVDTMKELGMSYPTVDKARLKELKGIRKVL